MIRDTFDHVARWGAGLIGIHPPPGPLAGFWSWKYLNIAKTARMVLSRRVRNLYKAFPDLLPPGSTFPPIDLLTTDGNRVDTRAFRGQKHFILITGAIT